MLYQRLPGRVREGVWKYGGGGGLLSNMLFALVVAGIESAEEGPGVTLNKLGMLRNKLAGRLEALRWFL